MDKTDAPAGESWLNGWARDGDRVLIGSGDHCAGCGRLLGVVCVIIDAASALPANDPAWPFDEESCPVCRLRALMSDGPEDKLTARLMVMQERRKWTDAPCADIAMLRDALAELVRAVEPIEPQMQSGDLWFALESARHVLGATPAPQSGDRGTQQRTRA